MVGEQRLFFVLYMVQSMNLGRKLTSLKFQVQLPIYNVHAIIHQPHDLTGNDDKSLKGESISVSLFSERLIQ